jgi:hypothetical protein
VVIDIDSSPFDRAAQRGTCRHALAALAAENSGVM